MKTDNQELKNQVAALESEMEQEASDEEYIVSLAEENETLTEQISNLESTNTELQDEVDGLETELASAQSNAASVSSPPSSASGSTSSSSNTVYYENCSEARLAGAAPVYEGDPGYASHLNRDGFGCE